MQLAKILVVEDEGLSALALVAYLEMRGYEVCSPAATGEEGIAIAEDDRPNLVLMDINLPGEMDGIDAAREIHARFGIPSIFLSGYPRPEETEGDEACRGYLVKPFSFERLEETISAAMKPARREG